ncbi:DNA polymerase III subunit delta' [Alkalihalophilus pseudofirmus OF4]|uniref:DNA polymerase III subunit delta' n=2 Tax=Alkalihalophilus pseudofirmus TaxID=79885 RepID=D3FQY4_ALKPO|nr:DNA polymerase III subunit delta' [Alkalihalophilus pseudofirmus]ADC49680.1 DNA polymerase III subunit delta' [Alkalihalophilus pseudofirmus OF4]MDV2887333.1 DNA polymerase III subunit delta' [Alkalihalophilus pseudofirmus]
METWNELKDSQPKVVQLLQRSLEKDRLAHAYLFEGSKGTGKKQIAFQLAKSFLCKKNEGAEPCLVCADCKRIDHRNHPDVHIIEPEGLSIKKQQVEHLQKEFTYRGVESGKKVYIVDQADKMTASAANSLLKFLEEPTAPTLAVLMTERASSVLPTIQSRSQQLSFSPLPREKFIERLEKEGISRTLSTLIAGLTQSYEEAIALMESDWIAQARSVVIQLNEELYERPHQVFLTIQDKWIPTFKERRELELGLDMILLWLRDLLYTQVGKTDQLVFADQQTLLEQQALSSSQEKTSQSMSFVLEAKRHLSANVNPQLVMEKLFFSIQEG